MTEAEKLEFEILEKVQQLAALRRAESDREVPNYAFETTSGETSLLALFAGRERLLVIHNMGQGCRYCTLWADGINGVLDHLEDAMAVVLVSKDPPETQRRMALDRGWKFRMASHGGGTYMAEQCALGEYSNYPGASVYERKGSKIVGRGRTAFGPGDLYSPVWHFLGLAGLSEADWTPQFHYWQRPKKLDDGGENIIE
ncbi:DUF899 family protein [Pelagibius sp. Alg239-R121]|uniref:DUF899 family protein n=1 Tax=Pelagibius sp. Alg239-R121 TaxID=2993448 RepID=UPI0024A6AEFA|nr:DUF899 family protein [Pelagibius sp. Alg239-R121]